MSVKLGIAPIAWSNDDMPELGGDTSLEQCLSEASQAGFIGIESGGKFPKNSEELIPKLKEFNLNDKYLIFSGIGNHKTFVETVRGYGFKVQKDLEFPDHYNYKNKDLDNIFVEAEKLGCKILTTEKDYFRLENKNLNEIKFIKSDLKIIDEEKLLKSII